MNVSYNSDSTYCSLIELSGNHHDTRKKIKSTSQYLDEIFKMITLHMENKNILRIYEVEKYMKKLSRMPFRTNKHHILAEKLKAMLYQIHKWNKVFEKTMSSKDPILDCGLTQDFQMMKEDQDDLKPMYLPIKNASLPASFCSEMLSNRMFITKSECNQNKAENINTNQAANSMDMFSTDENDLATGLPNIVYNVPDLSAKLIANPNSGDLTNISDSLKKSDSNGAFRILENINSASSEIEVYCKNPFLEAPRGSNLFKVPTATPFNPNNKPSDNDGLNISSTDSKIKSEPTFSPIAQTHEGLTSLASKIVDMQRSFFPRKELFPETQQFPEVKIDAQCGFEAAKNLGSAFNKCYNDKIAKLHCDVGTGARSWDEVHEDLDYIGAMTDKATQALALVFGNIHLQEKRAVEREYRETVEKSNFHNLREEDLKALEWEDFMACNEARLAELSKEQKNRFFAEKKSPVRKNYSDDEDYSNLDWRNYNKDQ